MEIEAREEGKRKRILGRRLAREVSSEDMKRVVGGAATISYAGGYPGDIDESPSFDRSA
jgi:hypothetical protein